MQAIETAYGWLILDGDRWCGPGIGWRDNPRLCRYSFNSRLAAEATIATLTEIANATGSIDLKTGTEAKAPKRSKHVRALGDSGETASGELDYPPAA